MPFYADWRGVCFECGAPFEKGTPIEREQGGYRHAVCPEPDTRFDPALDGKYNALTQKVDRIMTGDQRLRVSGGASFMAETEKHDSRTDIRFNHNEIIAWAQDGRDRTALTLALNLHELGHVFFTPAPPKETWRDPRVRHMLNALEDQRQEMLLSLRFPKAADYFRFLNARAIARDQQRIDGRWYLWHYGRRHLYPAALNAGLRELAVTRYGVVGVHTIERLITEYMLLELPEDQIRGIRIAEELVALDPDSKSGPDDLRHDCLPEKGSPTVRPKERRQLAERLKKLIGEPGAPAADEPGETVSVAAKPEPAPKPESADPAPTSPEDRGTGEPGDAGQPKAEAGKAPEAENASTDPLKDETGSPLESEETQSEPDAHEGTSGEGDSDADAEDETDADEDEADDDEAAADSDAQAIGVDDLGETDAEAEGTGRGGRSAGATGTGTEADPGDLGTMLQLMEDGAIDKVAGDLDEKHAALKATQVPVNMGGKARGALEGEFAGSARQLAGLFREINQDLKPMVHRNLKRGRLDARRVSVAVANNSPRMFKRRQADLSPDAAMAVSIMIDVSSSMYRMMHQAIGAGFALARGVEMAGHIAKVTTYDTVHKVQKNWLDRQYSMRVQHGGGGTSPYQMLRLARSDFHAVALHEEIHNHVAIIVTDGAWSSPVPCQEAIDALVKDGVFVILIGIGMVPEGFERVTVLTTDNVQGLAAAMTQPLRKLAIEIARSVRKKVAI